MNLPWKTAIGFCIGVVAATYWDRGEEAAIRAAVFSSLGFCTGIAVQAGLVLLFESLHGRSGAEKPLVDGRDRGRLPRS